MGCFFMCQRKNNFLILIVILPILLSTVIATSSKHPSPSILKPNKGEKQKQMRAPSRMKKVKIIKKLPTPIRSESKWSRYLRKKALDTKRGRFSPSNGTADEAGPSNVALCEPGALSSDSEDAESDEDYVEHTHEVIPEIPANIVALLQIAENTDVLDFGAPTSACFYCGAFMWASEKSGKIDSDGAAAFSLCCMKGKVDLPLIPTPPPLLLDLITDKEPRAQNFKENIRAYNSMFSFTSMGGKVLTALNDGGGPPQFVLSGQNYHRMGSLIPRQGQPPKFAQLYIYDTQNENSNRVRNLSSNGRGQGLDLSLVEDLKQMIDRHNVLAKIFRQVRERLNSDESTQLSICLFRAQGKDPRTYNMSSMDEVAALIVGDIGESDVGRDVVVKMNDGYLSNIPETHTAFIPLHYPLIFPYGEDGFREDIPISEIFRNMGSYKRWKVSMRQFISFRLQDRNSEYGNIIFAKRLFQQFVVDAYTMIEANRLSYIRFNQKTIRADYLNGVAEAIEKGETDPSSVGKRIILPPSFTGGRRYMFNNCQDAMSICKKFGYPDLFITATCNSQWGEIQRYVRARNLRAEDRPDICVRVFKMKLDNLMSDLRKITIFGPVDAGMYTVEFQKRGLPHAHILQWLKPQYKLITGEDIDKFISAELPDPQLYPKLYKAVSSFMIHDPCGVIDPKCTCMVDFYPVIKLK
ncbi:uncharacterized protein LOC130733312 [Lotus japonicus]|uniref:uncharacterized protein LOC130733312 n=1 Tax=Lotus japonicus TaxID=34305 RepID=UPI002590ECD0|nr:uncharacterized protein LOC130733312 [Lotus japonicus]